MLHFNTIYGVIALITGAIIVVKTLITLIFGGFDLDFDGDGDIDSGDFDAGVLLSPKGILSFLFGGSWYLVLSEYVRGGFLKGFDYLIAIGVGLVCSIVIALIYWAMSKLADEKKQESGQDLVGRSAEIYLNLDESYEIFVEINGSKRRLVAYSKSGKIYKTCEITSIVSYENGKYFIE